MTDAQAATDRKNLAKIEKAIAGIISAIDGWHVPAVDEGAHG
ncbi:hypothetical protein [Ensifer canadensis]|jgi:hypothetical protein